MSDAITAESSLIRQFIAAKQADEPGFSISSFAELVGCPRSAIYRILNGEDPVGHKLLRRIEAATGIKAVALYAEWDARRAANLAAQERASA